MEMDSLESCESCESCLLNRGEVEFCEFYFFVLMFKGFMFSCIDFYVII